VLEDDPHFTAGRGAALTYDGGVSLDAAIMDGATRAAGSVAGVTVPRNPVSLARAVMADGTHVMLSGAGADQFATERGVDPAPADWFEIPERRRQLEEVKARGADWFDVDMKYGTVGAVACDAHGHVAAATSTGGITGKRWGRIGDTPLIGAGTYADDRAAAVSATGSGEFFIRAGAGHEIAAQIRLGGAAPGAAADSVLADIAAMGGKGGVIVVAPDGAASWHFTTRGMFRGRADARGTRAVAIYGDED
jgi:beta-aspartyl-peptidase (threonine type)